MFVKHLVPALAAIGSVAAQSRTCTVSTTTIQSQAEATGLAGCQTVSGTVVIGSEAPGTIQISGPEVITGDLIVRNNSRIETVSSDTIERIGGEFNLNDLNSLRRVEFTALTQVDSISWISLGVLNSATLGPLTRAENIIVSDTFLDDMSAFDLTTVGRFDVNNNRPLERLNLQFTSVNGILNIKDNGLGLQVSLPNLIWVVEMSIANATSFSAPLLRTVNGSANFDQNFFESFMLPNLTSTERGDISFISNGNLNNLTFPVLTSIGGGLLIANNTELTRMAAFPRLEEVGGAVKLRGSFDEIEFPALELVEGAFDVASTEDIEDVCEELLPLAPRSDGGDGRVQGEYNCAGEVADANEDTSSETSDGGNGVDDDENSASGVALNTALFGLVAVAAIASAL
ncbi:Protein ecm33 [Madurella mycetomatis]|uniref:Protein ecm33 n=1 Tax=Madurella mycetomatis TaxID=100816 RepID=A0A175WE26_9PEZI|nr:Protein ecm33 [Madurella mycetomatis]